MQSAPRTPFGTSLIISNGVHKDEIEKKGIEETSKSYEAICNYIQSELKW